MSHDQSFAEAVQLVCQSDSRYNPDAYHFLLQALRKAQTEIKRQNGHVTAHELLKAFCSLAIEEFGPMAFTVVEYWGIEKSEDVGNMVYNLIEVGAFSKTERDSPDDFRGVLDFKTALTEPFLPASKKRAVA